MTTTDYGSTAESGARPLLCSFALGRGMYCSKTHRHDGQHAPDRAPVNGPPYGTISWAEHEEAWLDYARRHRGQDALRIAVRGGFGLWELCDQLGHAPQTWTPSVDSRERYVDGMKVLATAGPDEVVAVARAIERGDRVSRPDPVEPIAYHELAYVHPSGERRTYPCCCPVGKPHAAAVNDEWLTEEEASDA